MTTSQLPRPEAVRTFYRRPWLDRVTGHYSVAWSTPEGDVEIRHHNRLVDLQGHAPSTRSLLGLPRTVWTYLQTRSHPILPKPLPFLVWDAIDYLAKELPEAARVLEVGAGNSSLWFLARGARVTSIEHSSEWADYIREYATDKLGPEAASRLELIVAEGPAAVEQLEALPARAFDAVLIDSMNAHTPRFDCMPGALERVAKDGLLILDNSDHPNNWGATALVPGEPTARFSGFGPMCSVVTQTTFWRDPAGQQAT